MEKQKKKRRNYDNYYPSVTTVISQLQSYGLTEWFKRTPYNEILEASKRGREIGSQMHEAIQFYIETGEAKINTAYPEEITTALKSFMLFREEHPEYELQRAEIKMECDKYGVNGTTDCLAIRDGKLWIADWKSAKNGKNGVPVIYSEAKIQVSAYVMMLNELEKKNIENALIVAISKETVNYTTYEMSKEEIEGQFNEVFLPLVKIWNYKKGEKK